MTLSVAVMAHPNRADEARRLARRLDGATIAWDEGAGVWDTGRRALLAHQPTATHHLVIQDDAQPCRALLAGVNQALEHVPAESPVSLYLGRVRPFAHEVQAIVDKADQAAASWVVMNRLNWGVALVIPTVHIPDLVAWADTLPPRVRQYDRRVSRWFETNRIRCWYPWPSLVEHAGDTSIVHVRREIRRAHRFIGTNRHATTVDWSGPVIDATTTRP